MVVVASTRVCSVLRHTLIDSSNVAAQPHNSPSQKAQINEICSKSKKKNSPCSTNEAGHVPNMPKHYLGCGPRGPVCRFVLLYHQLYPTTCQASYPNGKVGVRWGNMGNPNSLPIALPTYTC